jgi:hypothetical protein
VTEDLASAVNDGAQRNSVVSPNTALRCALTRGSPGVADVFNNQRVIEAEARELQACSAACASCTRRLTRDLAPQVQAQQFAKQTSKWINMVNDFDKALKARVSA